MENMPDEIKQCTREDVYIVTEGGSFNGAYLSGVFYFLKEMEKRKHIRIKKMSTCSVSSLYALGFMINNIALIDEVYAMVVNTFKTTNNMDMYVEVYDIISKNIPTDTYSIVSGKLYIAYYDIIKRKKVVRTKYTSNDDLIESIRRSGFVPYLIDRKFTIDGKYIDGITPYIFKNCANKRVIYLQLVNMHNIIHTISVKNEKNSIRRILTGVLDAHQFFATKTQTTMCSYMNHWSYKQQIVMFIRRWIEYICIFILSWIFKLTRNMSPDNIWSKLALSLSRQTYNTCIQHYCV